MERQQLTITHIIGNASAIYWRINGHERTQRTQKLKMPLSCSLHRNIRQTLLPRISRIRNDGYSIRTAIRQSHSYSRGFLISLSGSHEGRERIIAQKQTKETKKVKAPRYLGYLLFKIPVPIWLRLCRVAKSVVAFPWLRVVQHSSDKSPVLIGLMFMRRSFAIRSKRILLSPALSSTSMWRRGGWNDARGFMGSMRECFRGNLSHI